MERSEVRAQRDKRSAEFFLEHINFLRSKQKLSLIIAKEKISFNIGDKRSFRSVAEKIWENCEPSNFPFIPCYMRVNETEWSESAASP